MMMWLSCPQNAHAMAYSVVSFTVTGPDLPFKVNLAGASAPCARLSVGAAPLALRADNGTLAQLSGAKPPFSGRPRRYSRGAKPIPDHLMMHSRDRYGI